MKNTAVLKTLAVAALLLVAASAYAGNVTLSKPAVLNGKQLAAGGYQIKVAGAGPVADVTFLRGKTEIVTAKATLKDLDHKAPFDAVVTKAMDGSGVPSITEIEFQGKRQALVFDDTARASNER
jgi:hypothetical protein